MVNEDNAESANTNFYEAFNKRDIELMEKVWASDASATCIHPGWPPLKGFEAIINSWAGIFENSGNMEVQVSDLWVLSSGDLASVSCTEKLYTIAESGVLASQVFSTNLFCRKGELWKMVMHHASPVPDIRKTKDSPKN